MKLLSRGKVGFWKLWHGIELAVRCHSNHAASARAQAEGWHPVIGLEIHAQIKASSKLFSSSSSLYGQPVNSQVHFLDYALPGTLPVLNKRCVEAAILTSLALACHINKISYFDRKHYFYADMPAGYQITQQRQPIARGGHLSYIMENKVLAARITQLQLEQDSGKSLHNVDAGHSLIDLNRAGIGLMEIVTEPDFTTAQQARAFVKELQLILLSLDTCSCQMSEGSLRVDASISLHREHEPLGTRCEVKNLNSLGFLEKAIDYEINRQLEILSSGAQVENETLNYISEEGITVPMRDKEKVHDYRFMPEPNLLPLRLYDNSDMPANVDHNYINIDILRASLPVLPMKQRDILVAEFGLTMLQADHIVNAAGYWQLFIDLCRDSDRRIKLVYDVLMNALMEVINAEELQISETSIQQKQIADVIDLLAERKIPRLTAVKVLRECVKDGQLDVLEFVTSQDLLVSHNRDEAEKIVKQILEKNKNMVDHYYKKGKKTKHLNKIVSVILEQSNNRYDALLILSIVEDKLQ